MKVRPQASAHSSAAARRLALEALHRIDDGAYANLVTPALLERSRLTSRDRNFVTAIAYGATRMRRALDHLVDRHVRRSTDDEVRRVLRLGGRLLVLQPNVRYCARDYWQFFDHITPVDDRALLEAFAATGYNVILNIPRFLPYTTKSRLPSGPALVKLYLRVPLAWRVLGAQAFMVATPTQG